MRAKLATVAIATIGLSSAAMAATSARTFTVSVIVEEECVVTSVDRIDPDSNQIEGVDAGALVRVECVGGTPYRIDIAPRPAPESEAEPTITIRSSGENGNSLTITVSY